VNVLCNGGATGSANITVAGGTSPYNYLWSNGATSEDLTNVSTGTYTLTSTDANGCSATTSVVISQPSTPLSIALSESPATCGLNNGSAQAIVTGGTPIYTYIWSPNSAGQTTPTINLLNNDIYTVTATDANGCTIFSSITVTRITPPQIEITSVTQETCSNANGSITVSVTNGTSPFVYTWSSNPELNTNSLFHVSQGQYTVVVTDHYGCSDTEVITISNHLAQIVTIDSILPAHCNHADGCAFATVEGGSGSYQFHWSTMPQNTNSYACGLLPGSYTVTVSDGFCDVPRNFKIENTSGPSADLTINRRYALISDASFSFTNLSHDYTSCIWDFGDHTTSTLINPTHVYSEPGTYQVILTVIDEFGCTNTANIEVIVSTELILWIGNSFTPNGDGINDEYGPVATGFSEKGYEFRIYDRWGKEVFFSNDYYHRWDGKIKGETITTSFVFSWIILIYDLNGKQYKFKGSVSALGGE
jgi:gliding motility-associated-like protein